jgi:hypothetical protein
VTGGEGDKPVHARDEQWARRDEECFHALLNERLEESRHTLPITATSLDR